MEFKQPNRYGRVPERPTTPARSVPVPPPVIAPQAAPQPILQPAPKPVLTQKKTVPPRVRRALLSKKGVIIISSALLIVLAVSIAAVVMSHTTSKKSSTAVLDPGYHTILPVGKTIEKLGGWERISPTGTDPVFAFADKIDGVSVSVSEQPLPASFQADTDNQVAQLAKAYSATDSLDASGTKVYVGTSSKGPQSTIFTKDKLLVLIKSQTKVEDKAWMTYVSSLN